MNHLRQHLKTTLGLVLVLFTLIGCLGGATDDENTGQNNDTTYLHTNALGSVIATSDDNGIVTRTTHYKPFGGINTGERDENTSFDFAGHAYDSNTGLIYMGARWYDPTLRRFISPDPIDVRQYIEGNTLLFNQYGYANQNPFRFVDPDGRMPFAMDSLSLFFASLTGKLGEENQEIAVNVVKEVAGVNDVVEFATNVQNGNLTAAAQKAAITACKPCKAVKSAPKFPKDTVTPGARRLANKAMTEADPKKAKAFRELIPKNQKDALSKHFDNVADFNEAKRGSGVQVDLQRGRARFLRGDTNTPPGNATNFNRGSLE